MSRSRSLEPQAIIISISASPGKPATIDPDPAVVRLGLSVEWRLSFDENYPHPVEWTVYFRSATPFKEKEWREITERPFTHVHYLVAGTADREGEYKYGVRRVDTVTKETLGDDDPILIVIR